MPSLPKINNPPPGLPRLAPVQQWAPTLRKGRASGFLMARPRFTPRGSNLAANAERLFARSPGFKQDAVARNRELGRIAAMAATLAVGATLAGHPAEAPGFETTRNAAIWPHS